MTARSIAAGLTVSTILATPSRLAAQDIGPTFEVTVGYSRLYHADGYDVQLGVMAPIGRAGTIEHRVGLMARFATSDLASIAPSQQRHMLGVGIRYAAVFLSTSPLAAFVGATAQILNATTTRNDFVSVGSPIQRWNPEDAIGINTTGPAFGGEGGLSIRLSGSVRVLFRGSIEYQAVYTNPSTHIVWGFSGGLAFAIRSM